MAEGAIFADWAMRPKGAIWAEGAPKAVMAVGVEWV